MPGANGSTITITNTGQVTVTYSNGVRRAAQRPDGLLHHRPDCQQNDIYSGGANGFKGIMEAAVAGAPFAAGGLAGIIGNRQPVDKLGTNTARAGGTADTIVLGHYPAYVEVAKETGGRRFEVPTQVWDKMTSEQQWAANQKFLDRAIARGSRVQLATPVEQARVGSYFEQELRYMQSKGHTVGPGGMSLIAPGSP